MASQVVNCPHCKNPIKLSALNTRHRAASGQSKTFHHTVQPGTYRLWRWTLGLFGDRPDPDPGDERYHFIRTGQGSYLKISESELREFKNIARVILELELGWSRDTITRYCRLSQHRFHNIKQQFEECGFLQQAGERNLYQVTPPGVLFLRGVNRYK